jgi:NTP pyrophosphatase (non-canonical NTP hydrolase)
MDFRTAQSLVWENKHRQGFNTTDVPSELCFLQGEISEFFDAWRKGQPGVPEELADVAIYTLALAEMVGIDLGAEVERKIEINSRRKYTRKGGVILREDGSSPSAEVVLAGNSSYEADRNDEK